MAGDPNEPQLRLRVVEQPDGTTLHAAGELDASNAAELAEQINAIVDGGAGMLTVNASELTFIDSTGLHVLLNAQRRLTRKARRLRMICVQGAVRRAIELSRLTETLNVAPLE
jgi:anti-anti-sigma factor